MFCIAFYTHSGNMRLVSCSSGSAHAHALDCVLHRFRPHQASKRLLWECPHSCFASGFTCIQAISGDQVPFLVVPALLICIVFCMPLGSIRLANCFSGSARFHVSYFALHVFGPCRASELLLCGCTCYALHDASHSFGQHQASKLLPCECHSCFVLCSTRVEAVSS